MKSIEPTDKHLPAVRCASWCENGDGHPLAAFVDEQACWGVPVRTELSTEDLVRDSDGQHTPYLEVFAHRHVDGAPTVRAHVQIGNGEFGFGMTIAEALALRTGLDAVLDQVGGASGVIA
ncbi:hypothetical protein [Nocardia sp. NPDC051981]|uniref:hypothetical protein n=1 Tax=Nocardia sp. NPDC051981 TaxID=3155417 RepID=UPI0034444A1D